ncbi:hypothetical protein MMC26_001611 [Xylographa opegraphella]|nr:hypothetical protein [Xylographa opegraphella]
MSETSTIPVASPPWTLKATVYMFAFHVPSKQPLPAFAYSPLESQSAFSSSSKFCGGLGSVQVIRYTESPVGPYDEMLLVPGNFEYEASEGGKVARKRNLQVSRIYVSQKLTCYNGRINWNIPKHLARFSFTSQSPGTVKVEVFPNDTTGDSTESTASARPFFTGIYSPVSYIPRFPFSTRIAGFLGIDFNLVQPPLPEGNAKGGELPGTTKWCRILPLEYSNKTSMTWVDLKQTPKNDKLASPKPQQGDAMATTEDLDGVGLASPADGVYSDFENWWPGLGRWQIGLKLEDATVEFGEGTHWD